MKLTALLLASALALVAFLTYIKMQDVHSNPPQDFVDPSQVDQLLQEERDLVAIRGTGSMDPYIPGGAPDKIVAWAKVERCSFDELKIDQIVVFSTDRFGLVLHRLAQRTGAGFITSGDHNHGYDSTRVYPENFRGRVVKTYLLK